jgi:hypothetical protein
VKEEKEERKREREEEEEGWGPLGRPVTSNGLV